MFLLILQLYIYMAFTRFHDDNSRIEKQLQELTGAGRYMMNVPGPGDKPCFMDDPYLRLQQWGANLNTNAINLESDLMGLTRTANKDCIKANNYQTKAVKSSRVNYPVCQSMTEQPRATHPAWTARDLEQVKWDILPHDPQEHTAIPFHNNLNTRILEKDNHKTNYPSLQDKTILSEGICIGGKNNPLISSSASIKTR
jgi:hypothetical protein